MWDFLRPTIAVVTFAAAAVALRAATAVGLVTELVEFIALLLACTSAWGWLLLQVQGDRKPLRVPHLRRGVIACFVACSGILVSSHVLLDATAAGGSGSGWQAWAPLVVALVSAQVWLGCTFLSQLERSSSGGGQEALETGSADAPEGLNRQLQQAVLARIASENELVQTQRDLKSVLGQESASAKRAEQALIRHERLLALGQMASGIAHRLNNTLTPIVSYTALLSEKAELPTRQRRWLENVTSAAEDAVQVVNKLQQFSRDEREGEFVAIGLAEVVNEVREMTQPIWAEAPKLEGRRIRFETDLPAVPEILGRPAQIRQVLTNLVLNAAESIEGDGLIRVAIQQSRGQVLVHVTDDGRGMTPGEIKRCCDPFYTTKLDGTGLGLSVCHGILSNHNGSIDIASTPGEQTTFTLRFPASAVPSRRTQRRQPPKLAAPVELLFIEDHDGVRVSVACMLESHGVSVTDVKTAEEALNRLAERSFDIIFTDLGLPIMDGAQLTQRIRQTDTETPIVVMSGWPQRKVHTAFKDKPAPDAIMGKPAQLAEIMAAIQRLTKASARPVSAGRRDDSSVDNDPAELVEPKVAQ